METLLKVSYVCFFKIFDSYINYLGGDSDQRILLPILFLKLLLQVSLYYFQNFRGIECFIFT